MALPIYFDESGVTGTNLVDPDHPVLVIASNSLSADVAADLKKQFFPFATQGELKHKNLKQRRPASVVAYIQFIADKYPDKFKFFVLHKQFALVVKVVQYWVEDDLGPEARWDGFNLVFATLAYEELMQSCGSEEAFVRLMKECRLMFAEPDYHACENFWQSVSQLSERNPHLTTLKKLLNHKQGRDRTFYEAIFTGEDESGVNRLSVHLTTMLALFGCWQSAYPDEQFEIYHDAGSEMEKYTSYWNTFLDPKRPGIYRGPQQSLQFPLPVVATDFSVCSKDCLQIQLADVLAGAVAEVIKGGLKESVRSDYGKRLVQAGILKLGADAVLPDLGNAISEFERLRGLRLQGLR